MKFYFQLFWFNFCVRVWDEDFNMNVMVLGEVRLSWKTRRYGAQVTWMNGDGDQARLCWFLSGGKSTKGWSITGPLRRVI